MQRKLFKPFLMIGVLLFISTSFAQETCNPIDVMTSPTKKFSTLAGSQYCATSAKIVWKDGETGGTRRIDYGKSTSYGQSVPLSGSTGTASLSGLTPNTLYYWRVFRSGNGQTVTTPAGSFTTTGGAVVLPPVITSAASVSCTTGVSKTYTATATDPAGKTVTFTYGTLPSWITSSGATLTLKPVSAGNTTVRIFASNGSAYDTLDLAVTVIQNTGISSNMAMHNSVLSIKIGKTGISFPFNNEKTLKLSVIALDGSLIMKKVVSIKDSEIRLNLSRRGTFICKAESKSGAIIKKIILQ